MTARASAKFNGILCSALVLLACGLLVVGCASGPERVLIGTGSASVFTYEDRGMGLEDARRVARVEAARAAQWDLLERYAGAVLPSEEVDPYLAEVRRMLDEAPGLIHGVTIERATADRDEREYHAVVTSSVKELRAALGDGPRPRDPITHPIAWPGTTGGLPDE